MQRDIPPHISRAGKVSAREPTSSESTSYPVVRNPPRPIPRWETYDETRPHMNEQTGNEGYKSFNRTTVANDHENNKTEMTTEIVAPVNAIWSTSKVDQKHSERHSREGTPREIPTMSRAYAARMQNNESQRATSLAPQQQQPQTRAFSMPRLMPSHYTAPGIIEASEHHRETMQRRLTRILEEHLWRPIDYPDGFKPNLKLDSNSVKRYEGSPKFLDLENWVSAVAFRYALQRLGGDNSEIDRARIMLLTEHLSGDAYEWYTRHIMNVNRKVQNWTFEGVTHALYDRFVHPSSMQNAREGFRNTRYTTEGGIQGYYDALLDHAHNMVIYPDDYTVLQTFLMGIPSSIITELLGTIGLSPETNSLEDFVAHTKEIEQRTKNKSYYMTLREKEKPRTGRATPKGKDTVPSKETMVVKPRPAPFNRGQARPPYKRNEQRRDKPFIDSKRYDKHVHKHNDAEEKHPHHHDAKQQSGRKCYNCGSPDHLSNNCDKPKKPRPVFVQAAHTVLNDEDSGNEPSGDDGSASEKQADQDENDRSEIEVEVTDVEYNENSAEEFMMTMDVITSTEIINKTMCELENEENEGKTERLAASVVFPIPKITQQNNADGVKMRKHKLKSSHTRRMRPPTSPEERECLATWVRVNGLEAWALWDSGSTTTGITPSFAEIAKVPVDTLEDPHILQLGTIGSRSTIVYGADVNIEIDDLKTKTYVDIANFDRYDMIIGTPFLRKNKVILDFIKNVVKINGRESPAVKVTAKDLDPRLRRHRTTEKKQE